MGSLTFLLTEFLATEITKEGQHSFLLLCLKVSFLLFFSPSIRPRIWFVCFCCCLGFLLVLGLDIGHALQLSKILSIFIKRNVPCSFSSSASFLGRDLIISVFVSSRMDGLNLSSILNLPFVLVFLLLLESFVSLP